MDLMNEILQALGLKNEEELSAYINDPQHQNEPLVKAIKQRIEERVQEKISHGYNKENSSGTI
ncbi:hypothetical protein [Veillonella magna]|uniref:Uncharacterized protein n=1 Tax=Veillonella magna TaxID=464322 RepID=A0ABS2GCL2_9FIRM|nr:hypothetical protein [Veillonella magna]MBM6823530.1 hypothetical protein [Veillonella magna]MBM6911874.1 hypothetical protein [Veillonella magna]